MHPYGAIHRRGFQNKALNREVLVATTPMFLYVKRVQDLTLQPIVTSTWEHGCCVETLNVTGVCPCCIDFILV